MDLSILFLHLIQSMTLMVASYISIAPIAAHHYERIRLTRLVIIDLQVSETLLAYATHSYAHEVEKFHDAFKRAGLSDDSTRKRKLLAERLGSSVSFASARFALFQAERIHGHPGLAVQQNNLHIIYNHIKDIYMKVEDISKEDAEQRIIDEASIAIAELDFEGKIPYNTSLRNPALDFFRQNVILNKDRQS